MRKFVIRYYWYNEINPEDVLITKKTVEEATFHDAQRKHDSRTVTQPEGYYALNWVVFETQV